MKKSTLVTLGAITAAVTGATAVIINQKICKEKVNNFNDVIKETFDIDETELNSFLKSLDEEEKEVCNRVYKALSKDVSFLKDVQNAVYEPHVPGNRTYNDILNSIIIRLPEFDKTEVLVFLLCHEEEIRSLFNVKELLDMKDFEDYLDYYNGKEAVIDEELVKNTAKLLNIKLTKKQVTKYVSLYA